MPHEGTVPERLCQVLREHPVGRYLLKEAVPVEQDAKSYGTVAYRNTEVMGDGWATVGDACGFMDPLYSHGIDFIGNTVWAVSRLILESLEGACVKEKVAAYNKNYAECCQRWFRALYQDKYYYVGDAELMNAAVLLDIGCYFIGPVRMVWTDHETELRSLPYGGPVGAGFGKFMAFYNRRMVHLAKQRRAHGTFGRRKAWMKVECSAWFGRWKKPLPEPAMEPRRGTLPPLSPVKVAPEDPATQPEYQSALLPG